MAGHAISVLIPVYNRTADLADLLSDLNRQDCRDFEVIVVDDGSTPPVSESISKESFAYPLRILRNERNRGIGYSRNRAVEAACGELIVWIDSDSRVPGNGWLSGHAALHRERPVAPGLPGEGAFVLHSTVIGATHNYAGRTFMYSNWCSSCQPEAHLVRGHHVPTNNTSLPRSLFDAVGRFAEDLEVAEDVDWGLRALRAGIPLVYLPGLPVEHADRDTMGAVWRSYVKMGRFAQRVRRRNPRAPYSWLYPGSFPLAVLMVLPLTLLITVYTAVQWFPVDRRVLWYIPGMLAANLAYALGTVAGLRELRRAATDETGCPAEEKK